MHSPVLYVDDFPLLCGGNQLHCIAVIYKRFKLRTVRSAHLPLEAGECSRKKEEVSRYMLNLAPSFMKGYDSGRVMKKGKGKMPARVATGRQERECN